MKLACPRLAAGVCRLPADIWLTCLGWLLLQRALPCADDAHPHVTDALAVIAAAAAGSHSRYVLILSSAYCVILPQVRSDCPPPRLLAFLVGEAGAAANEAAEAVALSKAEEEALLEQACAPSLAPASLLRREEESQTHLCPG